VAGVSMGLAQRGGATAIGAAGGIAGAVRDRLRPGEDEDGVRVSVTAEPAAPVRPEGPPMAEPDPAAPVKPVQTPVESPALHPDSG